MQGNTEKKSTFIRCNNPVQKTVLSILSIPNFHQSKALEPTVHRHDSYSNIYLCQVPQSLKFRTYCQSPITVNNVSNVILNGSAISKWSSLPLIIHYILLLSKNLLYWLNTKKRLTFLCFSDCFCWVFPMPAQSLITARCSALSDNVFFSSKDGQDFIHVDSNIAFSAILLL